jgi:outer membrane protein assembly factor BamB
MQPAIDTQSAYFGTWVHEVIAVNRRTGAIRWRQKISDAGGYTAGFELQPVGDLILATDRGIHALSKTDGARRWTFARPGIVPGVWGIPTDGRTVYAASPQGPTYAVDVASGALRWETNISPDTRIGTYGAVLHEGTVYVGFTRNTGPLRGGLAALDATNGQLKWMVWLPPADSSGAAECDGGAVVFGDAVIIEMGDGRIHSLDRSSGAINWTTPRAPNPLGPVDKRPLVLVGERVIAGSSAGWLTAYSARTGALLWHVQQRSHVSAVQPLVTDGSYVYSVDVSGELAAFDAATGAVRWRSGGGVPDTYLYAATVGDEAVFVHGVKGAYALRKE